MTMPDARPNVSEPLLAGELAPRAAPRYNGLVKGRWTMVFLWLAAVFVVGAGALMPSTWGLFSIPMTFAAIAVGLIQFMVNLFRSGWRAASIVLVSVPLAFATVGELRFSNELRFYMLRSYYIERIAQSPGGPYNIHGIEWDGGLGWDVTLEYHETETDARAWQRNQQGWVGPSCKLTLTEIAPHYFLNGIYC